MGGKDRKIDLSQNYFSSLSLVGGKKDFTFAA